MVLNGHYDVRLVALSYVIASAGSYLALRAAQQPQNDEAMSAGPPFRAINAPAAILGFTIWSMHFTGMAAFHIDGVPMGYRVDLTLLSLIVAMLFTWFGFATLWLARHLPDGFALAGALMGCGILTMHFTGMAAMTGDMVQSYDVGLAALSAVIAIGASIGALWFTTRPYNAVQCVRSALVMGIAICGMHYVGMQAAHFRAMAADMGNQPDDAAHGVGI